MKIEHLLHELKTFTEGKENVFKESGMINCYNKMQYGFFPLGLGILTENNKIKDAILTDEVEENGVMVLGNDFGTVSYVNSYVNNPEKRIGETDSKTINHLLELVPKINGNRHRTFFTNFYLGVRIDYGCFNRTTMTKRICDDQPFKIKKAYYDLCLEFFIKQVEIIKPKKVICLGHEVKNALIDSGIPFHQWEAKSDSLEKLYSKRENNHIVKNKELNEVEFIIIPHPCYRVNLKPPYLDKLDKFLDSK